MKKIIMTAFAILSLSFAATTPAMAVDVFQDCTGDAADTSICKASTTDKLFGEGSLWNSILNVFTYVIGAVAVLMMLVGAFRYVTSAGDAAQVSGAKNTIMYSAIGIVVAISANALVNFVLTNL